MKTHLKICNSLTQDERTLALLTAAKAPDSAQNPGPRAIHRQPTSLLTSSPSVSVPRPTPEWRTLPTSSTRTATASQRITQQSTTLYVPALKRSKSLHDGHGGVRTLAKVLPPRELQEEFSSDICRLFIAMNTAWAAAENPEFHTFIHKWVGPEVVVLDRRTISGRVLDKEVEKVENQVRRKVQGKLAMGSCDGWKNVAKSNVVTSLMNVGNEVSTYSCTPQISSDAPLAISCEYPQRNA